MVDLYICGTYSPRYSLVMFHLLINNIYRYSDKMNQSRALNNKFFSNYVSFEFSRPCLI